MSRYTVGIFSPLETSAQRSRLSTSGQSTRRRLPIFIFIHLVILTAFLGCRELSNVTTVYRERTLLRQRHCFHGKDTSEEWHSHHSRRQLCSGPPRPPVSRVRTVLFLSLFNLRIHPAIWLLKILLFQDIAGSTTVFSASWDVQPVTERCMHVIQMDISMYIWAIAGFVFLQLAQRYQSISSIDRTGVGATPKRDRTHQESKQSLEHRGKPLNVPALSKTVDRNVAKMV